MYTAVEQILGIPTGGPRASSPIKVLKLRSSEMDFQHSEANTAYFNMIYFMFLKIRGFDRTPGPPLFVDMPSTVVVYELTYYVIYLRNRKHVHVPCFY